PRTAHSSSTSFDRCTGWFVTVASGWDAARAMRGPAASGVVARPLVAIADSVGRRAWRSGPELRALGSTPYALRATSGARRSLHRRMQQLETRAGPGHGLKLDEQQRADVDRAGAGPVRGNPARRPVTATQQRS